MLKPERYGQIVSLVNAKSMVTVRELCDGLQVSKATIRRDLLQLDSLKMLVRTHGGAMCAGTQAMTEAPACLCPSMCRENQARIGAAAAQLVNEGETIYLGSGAITRAMASHLDKFHQLTVLTNDIGVAAEIAKTGNELIVAGGQLKRSSYTLAGFFAEQMLSEMQVDTAFFSSDYVSLKDGYMDCGIDEVSIKRAMVRNSTKTVLLCDSGRSTGSGFVTICPIEDVNVTISNGELNPEQVKGLRDAGMEVILV